MTKIDFLFLLFNDMNVEYLMFMMMMNSYPTYGLILCALHFIYQHVNFSQWFSWQNESKLNFVDIDFDGHHNSNYDKVCWYISKNVMNQTQMNCILNYGIMRQDDTNPKLHNSIENDYIYKFKYKGKKIKAKKYIIKHENGEKMQFRERVLWISGPNDKILQEFTREAIQEYIREYNQETGVIYHLTEDNTWNRTESNITKTRDNLFLPPDIKRKIFGSVEFFSGNPDFYKKYGIPYKLSFLLHGKPGTGKSSIAHVIANEFKRNIYSVQMGDLDDKAFGQFISRLKAIPEGNIILFDDADTYFKKYKRDLKKLEETLDLKTKKSGENEEKDELDVDDLFFDIDSKDKYKSGAFLRSIIEKKQQQLCKLLEFLDGYTSLQNTIVIMTTNDIDAFDSAIIRPGRIDHIIEFGDVTAGQVAEAFHAFTGENLPEEMHGKYSISISHVINSILIPNTTNPESAKAELLNYLVEDNTKCIDELEEALKSLDDMFD